MKSFKHIFASPPSSFGGIYVRYLLDGRKASIWSIVDGHGISTSTYFIGYDIDTP